MMILLILSFFLFPISVVLFFQQVQSFPARKEVLLNLYSSLLSDMNVDYRGMDMWVENIRNISRSIENFTDEVESLSKSLSKQSPEDQKWFLSLLEEFHQNLTLWISRHISELSLYEKEVEKISHQTSDESWKWVIRLSEKRIQNQIQIFKKI